MLKSRHKSAERWVHSGAAISAAHLLLHALVLRRTPEIFAGAASLGDLLANLSLAYVASYIFFMIVVLIPRREDRQNTYGYFLRQTNRITSNASRIIIEIIDLSPEDSSQEPSLETFTRACAQVGLKTPTSMRIYETGEAATISQFITYHLDQSRTAQDKILRFMHHVESELVRALHATLPDGLFLQTDQLRDVHRLRNTSLEVWAKPLWRHYEEAQNLIQVVEASIKPFVEESG